MIWLKKDVYGLHPFPKRFHKSDTEIPHVLYKVNNFKLNEEPKADSDEEGRWLLIASLVL